MLLGGLSNTAITPGSQAATSEAKLQEDMNRFLNLLVTQLKHQDPLDPLDTNEFTSQLVQFASVEQQIHQNANLEKLLSLQQSNQVASMVDFLGSTVEAEGKVVPLENGNASFTYALGTNAEKLTITISNSAGQPVFVTDGDAKTGRHKFNWDGKGIAGTPMPDGAYSVSVNALDRGDKLLEVKQTVFGRVTGAGADAGKVNLFLGDIVMPMEKVISVQETKSAG